MTLRRKILPALFGSSSRVGLGWLVALLLCPDVAQAHLVTTGLGPVYDGMGHFLLSPEDIGVVVALALLAGLRGKAISRQVLWILPLAWFFGGAWGLRFAQTPPSGEGIFAALGFMFIGVFVAADFRLPRWPILFVATAIGVFHGYANGHAMQSAGHQAWLQLGGVATLILIGTTLLSALVVSLKPSWARIVVRVLGSWIAAMGLLLLGWQLKPQK